MINITPIEGVRKEIADALQATKTDAARAVLIAADGRLKNAAENLLRANAILEAEAAAQKKDATPKK